MSQNRLYYYGKCEDGKLILPGAKMRYEIPEAFDGKPIRITVEQNRGKRSNSQNAYYWGVVLPCVLDGFIAVGNRLQRGTESIKMIHELLKDRFLDNGVKISDAQGQVVTGPNSTAALNKDEFGDYLDEIIAWAAEFLGVSIPEPGEQMEII